MNGYPTDEELERLISRLEEQTPYAPHYMKEQILDRVFPKETPVSFRETEKRRQLQIFSYRLKVIAGTAAALLMLAVLPSVSSREYQIQQEEQRESIWSEETNEAGRSEQNIWAEPESSQEKRSDLNTSINEKGRELNRKFSSLIGQLNRFEFGTIMDRKNGGNDHEN